MDQLLDLKLVLLLKGTLKPMGWITLNTFSPVAKLTSIRLFISMTATHNWPLHQLDIKNAFLHGDLQEEVYMEQPPSFVAQGEWESLPSSQIFVWVETESMGLVWKILSGS